MERAATSTRDRRSPNSIAQRALRPTKRMVEAATQLAQESDMESFTVQDVLERANVSLQTFYRHFGSKDDLLLAVIEEAVTTSAEAYRAKAFSLDDPVARVESVVKAAFGRNGRRMSRMITREHLRLMDGRAREVRAADEAYRNLLAETIEAAQAEGRFPGIDARQEADLVMSMVLSRYHNLVLGVVTHSFAREAHHVWSFCLAALSRGEPA
jgi:AcrR family transcriptional regulator